METKGENPYCSIMNLISTPTSDRSLYFTTGPGRLVEQPPVGDEVVVDADTWNP